MKIKSPNNRANKKGKMKKANRNCFEIQTNNLCIDVIKVCLFIIVKYFRMMIDND